MVRGIEEGKEMGCSGDTWRRRGEGEDWMTRIRKHGPWFKE